MEKQQFASKGTKLRMNNKHSFTISIAIQKDGRKIYTGQFDKSIQIWDESEKDTIAEINHLPSLPLVLIVSNDQKSLIVGSTGPFLLQYSLENYQQTYKLQYDDQALCGSSLHQNNDCFIFGTKSGAILEFDLRLQKYSPIKTIKNAHDHEITGIKLSQMDKFVFTSSKDCSIKFWFIDKSECIFTIPLEGHDIVSLQFKGGGSLHLHPSDISLQQISALAITSDDQQIVAAANGKMASLLIWEVKTGKQIALKEQAHISHINDLCLSSDDEYVISVSDDKSVNIWSFPTLELVHQLKAHEAKVDKVAIEPDCKYFITSSQDGVLAHWNFYDKPFHKIMKTGSSELKKEAEKYHEEIIQKKEKYHQLHIDNLILQKEIQQVQQKINELVK